MGKISQVCPSPPHLRNSHIPPPEGCTWADVLVPNSEQGTHLPGSTQSSGACDLAQLTRAHAPLFLTLRIPALQDFILGEKGLKIKQSLKGKTGRAGWHYITIYSRKRKSPK